jgi:hypothetical protein
MKIDRYKRDVVLNRILNDDLKQAKKALDLQRSSLNQLQKKNPSLQTIDEMSSINHVIGYLTGHIVALERTLNWLNSSAEELKTMLKEAKEIDESNKKMMRDLLSNIKKKNNRAKLRR